MQFHEDPTFREEVIRNYLRRTLDAEATEAFESHYLSCDECFEELRVTGLLLVGLHQSRIELRHVVDVLVLQFAGPAELTRQSFELGELQRALRRSDTKVLIDLGRVVKIDSAGLGQLISHYSHVVKNRGMLKLLNPNAQVETLLKLTRIDSVLETYHDERQALASF
jgi:anti-sigma B factor antagonist